MIVARRALFGITAEKAILRSDYISQTHLHSKRSTLLFFRLRSAAVWGGVAGVLFVYMTDWKVILGRLPYIKGRF